MEEEEEEQEGEAGKEKKKEERQRAKGDVKDASGQRDHRLRREFLSRAREEREA